MIARWMLTVLFMISAQESLSQSSQTIERRKKRINRVCLAQSTFPHIAGLDEGTYCGCIADELAPTFGLGDVQLLREFYKMSPDEVEKLPRNKRNSKIRRIMNAEWDAADFCELQSEKEIKVPEVEFSDDFG